jgi:hypothetical protein
MLDGTDTIRRAYPMVFPIRPVLAKGSVKLVLTRSPPRPILPAEVELRG